MRTKFAQTLKKDHDHLLKGELSIKQGFRLWIINMLGIWMVICPFILATTLMRFFVKLMPWQHCLWAQLTALSPKFDAWIGRDNSKARTCPKPWSWESTKLHLLFWAIESIIFIWWYFKIDFRGLEYFETRVMAVTWDNPIRIIALSVSFLVSLLVHTSVPNKFSPFNIYFQVIGAEILLYAAISALIIWYGNRAMRVRATAHLKSD